MGEIPGYLLGFPHSSFSNNPNLCGLPLQKCNLALSRPGGAMASSVSPKTTIASSPTAMSAQMNPPRKARNAHGSKINWFVIIVIIVGDDLVLGGPRRTPLDWTTRLKIASGAAHGLSFIHSSCKPLHGNIKSTNVLIDKDGNSRLSDYSLSIFSTLPSASKSDGYCALEASLDNRKLSPQSDVSSFGVLLLELLTGKCPSLNDHNAPGVLDLPRWVQSVVREEWTAKVFDLEQMRYREIEEEMVGLLQVEMACAQALPDLRPKMGRVVTMIDELRGVPSDEISTSE
ncbi:Probable leucine-rich repeat receptor-like protein kinase [Striga hermonthica]|uniref:Probable leucine-rich repeat receptor-like protein kinase n=1 Tax=Striga hermonthica TaxID=68872 RepID=A0A9N7MJI2_STRHE|nr:Probable leucine-rich repeat receptor-like protein kinase [Striga hermonthica]